MGVQKEITIPYNFFPRWYQLPYLASDKRFRILIIHRRAGKSMTLLNDQIAKTQKKFCEKLGLWLDPTDSRLSNKDIKRINTFYYVLPTYKQAKTVMWDALVRQHVPNDTRVVSKLNGSELAIYYTNGSIQRFVGCDDIDKHRGINPIDVVFDEYSEMNPGIWTAIFQPILAENGGTASFGYTPKGRNHSFHLLNEAKSNPDRWFVEVLGVSDTHAIPDRELEEVRKTTPQALYMQEYEVEFNENAGAFFRRVTANVHHDSLDYNPLHTYRMGVDLAMYNDYTVITILDLNTFKVHKQVRFNQIDWNLQKARIEALYHRFGCPEVVIDATGVGSPIALDLEAAGVNIMPFKFSAASKAPLLSHLAVLLEQDKIKIPNDPILIAEMESMTCGLTDKGKVTINTPRNMHDDTVMSLALACHGISDKIYSDDGESDEWLLKQQQAANTTTDADDLYNGI